MHCVSNYPGKVETQNLNIIQRLKKYNFDVGYSDHTIGYQSAIIASSLGARVFEKHITIKRSSKGPDHFFASEINETKKYINMLNITYKALGDQKFKLSKQVKKYRSDVTKVIGASKHIKKGEKLTRKNIEFKRSVFIGLNYDEFIKNKLIAKKDIKKNTTINKNMVINKK